MTEDQGPGVEQELAKSMFAAAAVATVVIEPGRKRDDAPPVVERTVEEREPVEDVAQAARDDAAAYDAERAEREANQDEYAGVPPDVAAKYREQARIGAEARERNLKLRDADPSEIGRVAGLTATLDVLGPDGQGWRDGHQSHPATIGESLAQPVKSRASRPPKPRAAARVTERGR